MAGINNGGGLDGWGEYQRLVLAELERHNTLISTLNTGITDIQLKSALREREYQDVVKRVDKLDVRITGLHEKLDSMQSQSDIDNALHKYRKWLLSGAFILITAFLIPLINLFLGK